MKKLKWIICNCCEGDGKVDHPAFSNGFTSSEWRAMDCDEQTAYMSGEYDVTCEECKGLGRIQVPNVAAMNFAEKRLLVIKRWEAEENARIDAEVAAERAFGC